jgi:hypothetical protein
MAEFKEISPNASAGAKLHNWLDNRFRRCLRNTAST